MTPEEQTPLDKQDIKSLMIALGFHKIPSRNRWKLKTTSTLVITDAELVNANFRNQIPDALTMKLKKTLSDRDAIIKGKLLLLEVYNRNK